jgi:hypothetical protein
VNAARHAGVVYELGGVWSNEDPTVRAVLAYEHLRRGESVLRSQAALAARFADGLMTSKADMVSWGDIVWPFDGKPAWMDALHRMGVGQREYIRSLLMNKESLVNPGRVSISTIHQAKGGECDNVLVLGDVGKRVENSFWADMDAELRVWYVAFSRAKENLFFVQPKQQNAMSSLISAF